MTMRTPSGVRIAGTGSAVPDRRLTNADLERVLDTSDDWIRTRTGIGERRIIDPTKEDQVTLASTALRRALDDAGVAANELDLIINATVTAEMTCPSNACRIANAVGATPAGALDIVAACSGFVYAMNIGEPLVFSRRYQRVAVIGCDVMSTVSDYNDRSVSILFGDAAGAAILVADDSGKAGCLHQAMHADASGWHALYMPRRVQEVPEEDRDNPIRLGCLRMNGREVYKFAVTKFREVIEDAMTGAGIGVNDVAHFVCHQMNVRIIDSAIEKIGLPREKVRINIDRYGNTSAGSVGLVLDELRRDGSAKRGDIVVLVAFGGGLTWSSSVWIL